MDGKSFSQALQDFDAALRLTPASELTTRARLLSGQALAREGLSDWRGALSDYDQALELADQGGCVFPSAEVAAHVQDARVTTAHLCSAAGRVPTHTSSTLGATATTAWASGRVSQPGSCAAAVGTRLVRHHFVSKGAAPPHRTLDG